MQKNTRAACVSHRRGYAAGSGWERILSFWDAMTPAPTPPKHESRVNTGSMRPCAFLPISIVLAANSEVQKSSLNQVYWKWDWPPLLFYYPSSFYFLISLCAHFCTLLKWEAKTLEINWVWYRVANKQQDNFHPLHVKTAIDDHFSSLKLWNCSTKW